MARKPSAFDMSMTTLPPCDGHRHLRLGDGFAHAGVPVDGQPGADGEGIGLQAAATSLADENDGVRRVRTLGDKVHLQQSAQRAGRWQQGKVRRRCERSAQPSDDVRLCLHPHRPGVADGQRDVESGRDGILHRGQQSRRIGRGIQPGLRATSSSLRCPGRCRQSPMAGQAT